MFYRNKQPAFIALPLFGELTHLGWPFVAITDGGNSLRRKVKLFCDFLSHLSNSRLSFYFFVSFSDGKCFVSRIRNNGQCLVCDLCLDVQKRAHLKQETFAVGHIAEDQNILSLPMGSIPACFYCDVELVTKSGLHWCGKCGVWFRVRPVEVVWVGVMI